MPDSRIGAPVPGGLGIGRRRGGRQLSGRDPYQRVVNFEVSDPALAPPGTLQPVKLLEATCASAISVRPGMPGLF